jgi:uncharacterized protein with von Willebrand factor type A (vWA) domain
MSAKIASTSEPPREGLVENVTRFSHLLRDNGVAVALPAVLDAIRGLSLIDIFDADQFKCLLRTSLICRRRDIEPFDRLFNAYWRRMHGTGRTPAAAPAQDLPQDSSLQAAEMKSGNPLKLPDTDAPAARQPAAIRYSPQPLNKESAAAELQFAASEDLAEAIRQMLHPFRHRLSRRLRYTIRGRQISLRRLLRKNMQVGGELIFLDYKKRKTKKCRVVFFCDVSGSMDVYTRLMLQFIHALKQFDRHTEVFLFSTALFRATGLFETADFAAALAQIPERVSDWGGGTRIGYCLERFTEGYGRCLLSDKDVVMIFSDGWDRGEADTLQAQMTLLKRRASKVIWLNPLIKTRDYQPICLGMRTALPYLDYFLPLGNLQDLRDLSRIMKDCISDPSKNRC